MEVGRLACCGVREIGDLSAYRTARGALKDFVLAFSQTGERVPDPTGRVNWYGSPETIWQKLEKPRFDGPKCGFVVFTQATRTNSKRLAKYGENFKSLIEELKLGEVTSAGPHLNPNTGNLVTVYLWKLDQDRLKSYAEEEILPRIKEGEASIGDWLD